MRNLTTEQRKEFDDIAELMMKFLNDCASPLCSVIIDNDSAELLEKQAYHKTDKYITD